MSVSLVLGLDENQSLPYRAGSGEKTRSVKVILFAAFQAEPIMRFIAIFSRYLLVFDPVFSFLDVKD